MKYLSIEDLEENIAVVKLTESYHKDLSPLQLYDISRGCWKNKLETFQKVKVVLAVHSFIVQEVYAVDKWLPATELHRETIPFDSEQEKGRIGFSGQVAPDEIRKKYIFCSVKDLFKNGNRHPIMAFLSKEINKEKKKWTERARTLSSEINDLHLRGMDTDAVVKVRINQGVFRDRLLQKYSHCCLCNVSNIDLLIASHIKPWKDSEEDERLDMDNGFLLCPNHDKLFDNGFISFDNTGSIIVSEKLDQVNCVYMNVQSDMKIDINNGNKKYLEYHREHILHKKN